MITGQAFKGKKGCFLRDIELLGNSGILIVFNIIAKQLNIVIYGRQRNTHFGKEQGLCHLYHVLQRTCSTL